MLTIANIVWLVLHGFYMALAYALLGLVCCALIVTIPFGVASLRLAGYALWPFGRSAVRRPDAGAASAVANVIWIVVAGFWLAIGHLVAAVGFFVTIIGIPFGIASVKMAGLALAPLGREIVPAGQASLLHPIP